MVQINTPCDTNWVDCSYITHSVIQKSRGTYCVLSPGNTKAAKEGTALLFQGGEQHRREKYLGMKGRGADPGAGREWRLGEDAWQGDGWGKMERKEGGEPWGQKDPFGPSWRSLRAVFER